jgi:hypothetical protein
MRAAAPPASGALNRWLRDYNEAPWRKYIKSLDEKGLLLNVDGILVDASAMFETRFRCDTRTCAARDRSSETESCCTDYHVEIIPEEKEHIVAHAPEIIALLNRYESDRVPLERDIENFFEESLSISLAKEKGRCGFSYRDAAGQLRCGLHSLALEKNVPIASIKPLTCVFFPVVVYRFENGDTLLTAISDDTADLMEGEKDSALPCLRMPQGDEMFKECRTAIETGFGKAFFEHLTKAFDAFSAAKGTQSSRASFRS